MTKEEQFVNELIGYIFAYPDDDYMTMECLCRKLHKYGLIDKKDGEWTTDFIDRETEPQIRCPKCGRTDYIKNLEKDFGVKDDIFKYKCINCNTYIKDEPTTEDCSTVPTISKMEQVGKPQADCGDFADRLAYERGVKHAWEVAQKVFNSTVTFYEAEDVAKQIDKDINVRSKDCKTCKWGEWYRKGYDITMMDDECGACCSWNSKWTPKDEPQTYVINPQEPTNDDKCFECDDFFTCGGQCNKIEDEPQTDTEIAKAIVHKMIDDAVIAEDAYPDLRQKMHDAVYEYEPQTDCAWK